MLVNGVSSTSVAEVYGGESNFTSYTKLANKIDSCIAALNFTKIVGDIKEAIRIEQELRDLRLQVASVKARNKKSSFK